MDETDDAPERRGRLHGRLIQVLGGFSALVALIALWQFGVFGGDPDRDPVGTVEGPETDWLSAGEERTGAIGSVDAASATIESPSESSAAANSASPSDKASSGAVEEAATSEEEDEEDAPAAASCSATLTLKESWDDSIEVTVEVLNSGSAELASWELDLGLDDLDIYNHWNMRELGSGRYGSEDWNGRLDPDENAVTGFQGTVGNDFELPDSVPCVAS